MGKNWEENSICCFSVAEVGSEKKLRRYWQHWSPITSLIEISAAEGMNSITLKPSNSKTLLFLWLINFPFEISLKLTLTLTYCASSFSTLSYVDYFGSIAKREWFYKQMCYNISSWYNTGKIVNFSLLLYRLYILEVAFLFVMA